MLNIKNWMETVNYRITEGSTYCWNCFGRNAYMIDAWDGEHDGVSSSMVFDTGTQEVYEVIVCDIKNSRAYRYINPSYKEAHTLEVVQRGLDDTAWDDVKFIDLDVDKDYLDKATAIMNYQEYDTRVSMPIDFNDTELLQYMKLAHDMDITFNKFIELAVTEALERDGHSLS